MKSLSNPLKLNPIEDLDTMQIKTIKQTVDNNTDNQPIFIEDGF